MGVDARMFVRLKGRDNWLAEADVLKTAYDLASTIGSDYFSIYRADNAITKSCGLAPQHALKIEQPIKDAKDAEYNGVPEALIGKVVWTQDGDEIVADDDEQFVRVNVSARYYGRGYERGPWPVLRTIIEWLARRSPGKNRRSVKHARCRPSNAVAAMARRSGGATAAAQRLSPQPPKRSGWIVIRTSSRPRRKHKRSVV